jgi:phosphoribosyl 1,2-cyclic phosphodiesterase/DNA-binding response OmpR family regulator
LTGAHPAYFTLNGRQAQKSADKAKSATKGGTFMSASRLILRWESYIQVKFWGTRGSLAKPGRSTERYGGNTSCVEIRSRSGTLIVLDCGTGAHALGLHLIAEQGGAPSGHLLISHTHWDHIQGIPFFAPLFTSGATWDIYGPGGLAQSLRATLAGQMEYAYFPVTLDQFAARIAYHELVEGTFAIGDVQIIARYLNHPALTLGYRIEADGASVVYCCDHEPHSVAMASGETALSGMDRRYADFVAGADLVIHDSQYTAREYIAKVGWGHSPVEYAVRVCREGDVKRLALTHYDPLREDVAVDLILDEVRQQLRDCGSSLEVLGAAEGMVLDLDGDPRSMVGAKQRFGAKTAIDLSLSARPIFLRLASSRCTELLRAAIAAEGFQCRELDGVEDLQTVFRESRPALMLIEHDPPWLDGLEVARAVQRLQSGEQVQIPVVLVGATPDPARETGVATDWLVMPFSESYARSRIRAWMLRVACRWVRAGLPVDEAGRLAALRELGILDTPAETRFDRLTRIAASALDVPIALVTLVDSERQWFKSCFGLDVRETSREVAFCAHVAIQKSELIVPDALLDDRFADNPLVVEGPRIRAYTGMPLILADGNCIGTFCVIDTRPRDFSDSELGILRDLRDLALEEIKYPRQA